MGKNKHLSQRYSPSLNQFVGKEGRKVRTHFGLKDLGHAVTD